MPDFPLSSLLFFVFLISFQTTITIIQAADCEVYGLALKAGQTKTVPGKCSLLECNGRGSDGVVIKSCPNAYAGPRCKFVPVNLSKTYPECCPHWDCEEGKTPN